MCHEYMQRLRGQTWIGSGPVTLTIVGARDGRVGGPPIGMGACSVGGYCEGGPK